MPETVRAGYPYCCSWVYLYKCNLIVAIYGLRVWIILYIINCKNIVKDRYILIRSLGFHLLEGGVDRDTFWNFRADPVQKA